nr:MAG TPA: hypothetical protein [Crassvirales sp.]
MVQINGQKEDITLIPERLTLKMKNLIHLNIMTL